MVAMRPAYEEAVETWRALGDERELANALYNYAFCYAVPVTQSIDPADTDPDGIGWAAFSEALAIFRAVGDERGQANVLWGMGNQRYFHRQPGDGAEEFNEALQIFRREGDRTMEAWSLHMLGSARLRQRRFDESRDVLGHALRHFHEAGDAAGITLVLDDLASQAAADGDPERAARLWGAARSLTSTTGAGLAGYMAETFEAGLRPSARGMITPGEIDRLAREGATMTLEEAVAYALEGTPRPPAAQAEASA